MKSCLLFSLVSSVLIVSGARCVSAGIGSNEKTKDASQNSQCAQNLQRSSLFRTKLIIVDGLPGSGKSTTAEYIKNLLDKNGIANRFYEEGNFAHPIHKFCDQVACLTETECANLMSKHKKYQDILQKGLVKKEGNSFIFYGKLKNKYKDKLPGDLFNELAKYNIDENDILPKLSLEKYVQHIAERWKKFVKFAEQRNEVTILESSLLQQEVIMMLGFYNKDKTYCFNYIMSLLEIMKKLDPIIIYLDQGNVRKQINKALRERDKEWRDKIANWDKCEYAKTRGLKGPDAFIAILKDTKAVQLKILAQNRCKYLMINNSDYDWERAQREIKEYLFPDSKVPALSFSITELMKKILTKICLY